MSSPNAQRWLVAKQRSTLQHGESNSSSALNSASSIPHHTEAYDEAEPSDSPYYSPPSTFMPPESPNTPRSSAHCLSASTPTPTMQSYVGFFSSKMSTLILTSVES